MARYAAGAWVSFLCQHLFDLMRETVTLWASVASINHLVHAQFDSSPVSFSLEHRVRVLWTRLPRLDGRHLAELSWGHPSLPQARVMVDSLLSLGGCSQRERESCVPGRGGLRNSSASLSIRIFNLSQLSQCALPLSLQLS